MIIAGVKSSRGVMVAAVCSGTESVGVLPDEGPGSQSPRTGPLCSSAGTGREKAESRSVKKSPQNLPHAPVPLPEAEPYSQLFPVQLWFQSWARPRFRLHALRLVFPALSTPLHHSSPEPAESLISEPSGTSLSFSPGQVSPPPSPFFFPLPSLDP